MLEIRAKIKGKLLTTSKTKQNVRLRRAMIAKTALIVSFTAAFRKSGGGFLVNLKSKNTAAQWVDSLVAHSVVA